MMSCSKFVIKRQKKVSRHVTHTLTMAGRYDVCSICCAEASPIENNFGPR